MRTLIIVVLLCLTLTGAVFAQDGAVQLPDTPAGRQFQLWLEAFEQGDPAAIARFYEEQASAEALAAIPAEGRANIESSFYRSTQGLTLHNIVESTETSLIVLAQGKLNLAWMQITLTVTPEEPHQVEMIFISAAEAPVGSEAQPLTEEQLVADIGTYVQRLAAAGAFSGSVMLTHNGETLYEAAYGLANRETDTPNDIETLFNMASMGKMFTAVAVMQLVEQGLVDVNAPISTYLDNVPADKAGITVHQLLTHTSGLAEMFMSPLFAEYRERTDTVSGYFPLFMDTPLQAEPGTQHQYSNSNFIVLGAIIEAVSGQDYFEYLQEHIFEVAGMTRTGYYERDAAVENLATGYTQMSTTMAFSNDWLPNDAHLGAKGSPAGGGYSTAGDMMAFARALLNHDLLSAETTALMFEGKVDSRPGEQYAYGFIVRANGSVGHGGGFPGVSAYTNIYPETGYAFVVFSNEDRGAQDITNYLDSLMNRLLSQMTLTLPVPGSADQTLPTDNLMSSP
jgi:CubicO group peptidase (beta-lactamase class C family)